MYTPKDSVTTGAGARNWDLFNMKRIIRATAHALSGLKEALVSEFAFQQECFVFLISVIVACIAEATPLERALLIGSIILVLLVELLNTALETIIDRISPEHHPLSKKAKDLGSAAVLLAILQAMIIWGFIFFT